MTNARRAGAFTLIELLIVVAIIAILALIAVPNFLESQTRAKTARARSEHRALITALEAYRMDCNAYPSAETNGTMKWMRWLSTPVVYITRVDLQDPFTGRDSGKINSIATYRYYGFNEMGLLNADRDSGQVQEVYDDEPGEMKLKFYLLFSHGPDRLRNTDSRGRTLVQQEVLFDPDVFTRFVYDPTNGTVSFGEILRPGGELCGRAEPAMRVLQQN